MQNNFITLLSVIRAIKENGNTYRSSGNYFIVKDDMAYVKLMEVCMRLLEKYTHIHI